MADAAMMAVDNNQYSDNSRLTHGPYAGETFRYVRIANPGYVFQLMNKPVHDVVPHLPFILYCVQHMRAHG